MPQPSTNNTECTDCITAHQRIAHLLEIIDQAATYTRTAHQVLSLEAAGPPRLPDSDLNSR